MFVFFHRLITAVGDDSSELIAKKIGQMYVNLNKKFKDDLSNKMNKLKEIEKAQDTEGKYFVVYG